MDLGGEAGGLVHAKKRRGEGRDVGAGWWELADGAAAGDDLGFLAGGKRELRVSSREEAKDAKFEAD
ncbi:MAG: hypothetical protein ACI89E_001809, partial [Planctomycetota bacterium]